MTVAATRSRQWRASVPKFVGIKNITFLVSDLKGSTALYDAVGDVQGYHLVRRHFAALTRAVAGHSGAIIKTIGDNAMATFVDLSALQLTLLEKLKR